MNTRGQILAHRGFTLNIRRTIQWLDCINGMFLQVTFCIWFNVYSSSFSESQVEKVQSGNWSCDEDSGYSLSPEQPVNQESAFLLFPLNSPSADTILSSAQVAIHNFWEFITTQWHVENV